MYSEQENGDGRANSSGGGGGYREEDRDGYSDDGDSSGMKISITCIRQHCL